MNRPKVVNLVLEDFGGDAEPIEKYIVDLEQERDQLKEVLNNIEKVIDGDPNNIYAFSEKKLVEHDAEVIEREIPDFKDPSTNNGDWRKDAEFRMGWNECIDVMKNRANQLRQKAQED